MWNTENVTAEQIIEELKQIQKPQEHIIYIINPNDKRIFDNFGMLKENRDYIVMNDIPEGKVVVFNDGIAEPGEPHLKQVNLDVSDDYFAPGIKQPMNRKERREFERNKKKKRKKVRKNGIFRK